MNTLPEWLDEPWQRLLSSHRQERLPHALLISGLPGIGKHLLAQRLTQLLLCEQPVDGSDACGRCAACNWLAASSHPDVLTVSPEETGKAIKIDQIRQLNAELSMTSHSGRYKIAVISPADAMNVNAANSLLKTLEEPTARTLLILITAAPGGLPATLRSRCHKLQVDTPSAGQALAWLGQRDFDSESARRYLSLALGAPLAAAELAADDSLTVHDRRLRELVAVFNGTDDPLRIASDWGDDYERQTLLWWLGWLQSLIRCCQTRQHPDEPDVAQMLQQISEKVDCKQLFELADRVTMAVNSVGSGVNRQLLLEDLLIDWARLAGPATRRSIDVDR